MRVDDLDLTHTRTATVVANSALTPPDAGEEVRELLLEVEGNAHRFAIGQSIAVLAPPSGAFGEDRHVRLYTVAEVPSAADEEPHIRICVRRCSYVDPFSGERYAGVASNYLCDLAPGDRLQVAGPYGVAFPIPDDRGANLLMVGLGTGIAPFRAFVRHIHEQVGGWDGRVRILHGARTGLEMIYRNAQRDDFAQYMDGETFAALEAMSPRPDWEEPVDFKSALAAHREEVWQMLQAPAIYVFVAGLEPLREALEAAFAEMAGSEAQWQQRKTELIDQQRWFELIY